MVRSLPVRPNECVIAVGIPTTSDEFVSAIAQREANYRDFACGHEFGGLIGYQHEVIRPFARCRARLERFGVSIQPAATVQALASLFASHRFKVIVLLTHFIDGDVELFDGMIHIDAVSEQVPPDFSGIIDLCMCEPMKLVARIKQRAPDSMVGFASARLTPKLWFSFYGDLFSLLRSRDLSYVEAIEKMCLTHQRGGFQ